ncbi:hypothetical protein TWF718_003095 [Orbilia javanica]|uniref:Uncharacterized protein n=1 Tax=Orbilia javanica TaxID=47235 RepID=A0AAN8MJC5_9PEZI
MQSATTSTVPFSIPQNQLLVLGESIAVPTNYDYTTTLVKVVAPPVFFAPTKTLDASGSQETKPLENISSHPDTLEAQIEGSENVRAVENTIFWSSWKVNCPSASVILHEMPPDPESYPRIGNQRRQDYRSDEEGQRVPGESNRHHVACRTLSALYQKTNSSFTPRGLDRIPLSEYQDALNKIPFGVRQQYPGFKWDNTPDSSKMKWDSLTSGLNDHESQPEPLERWLVPGTAEPYYLEGLNQDSGSKWEAGGRSILSLDSFGDSMSRFDKRSSVDDISSDSSPEPENKKPQ